MRDSFISAVLNKTVNVDYRSQIQEIANQDAISQLPINLQNKDTLHYLEKDYVYFDNARCMGSYYVKNNEYKPSDAVKRKVKAIHDLSETQEEKRKTVKGQLKAVIYGVTTLKAAKEVLPENLHQYLPEENVKPANSFAVVTTELMDNLKSLGLPA